MNALKVLARVIFSSEFDLVACVITTAVWIAFVVYRKWQEWRHHE